MDTLALARPAVATQPRQAALPGFLARRLLRMTTPPLPGTRAHLVETCRAELDWSVADWKRINPYWNGWDHEAADMAEAHRLPHERAAARLVNAHGHLDTIEHCARRVLQRIPGQRAAASRMDQSAEYRASWQISLTGSLAELDNYKGQLRRALVAYRKAGREYRRLRAEIDSPTGAPCMKEAA